MTRSGDAQLIAALTPGPWINLPLATGFTSNSGDYTAQYRIWRDTVQLRGNVTGTFADGVAESPFSSWPAPATPASQVAITVTASASADSITGRLVITAGGVATVICPEASTFVYLDGCSYQLI